MGFLEEKCVFSELTEEVLAECAAFDCGNDDLNAFFRERSVLFRRQRISRTYGFFIGEAKGELVGAFSLSNYAVRLGGLSNNRRRVVNRNIPHAKQLSVYPGVLIGRFGIDLRYQGLGIGSELVRYVHDWLLLLDNPAGCRFMVLDAVNQPDTLAFYLRNGFDFLYQNPEEEGLRHGYLRPDRGLATRVMFRDLLDTREGMR